MIQTLYAVIGEPFDEGAVHYTMTLAFELVTVGDEGIEG